MQKTSNLVIVGALAVFGCLALAGVLLVSPGPESAQRLGLFFGVVGTVVAALIGMVRADQTRTQTNGSLDDRIEAAVYRAQNVRRRQVNREEGRADDA